VLTGQNQAPINLAEIQYPSENSLWYDGNLNAQFRSPVDARHNGTGNAAFIDGHVKAIPCTNPGSTYNDLQGARRSFAIVGAAAGPYATAPVPTGFPGCAEMWGVILNNRTVNKIR
jgi:prepilin-type processing-associated H-X9-DG protein